jgi:hypothetical protein
MIWRKKYTDIIYRMGNVKQTFVKNFCIWGNAELSKKEVCGNFKDDKWIPISIVPWYGYYL